MKYLIEFTPIDSFAFSGETSLSNPGEETTRRASYLADSEYMPPQTTVLGTLRRIILEWAGLYRADADYRGTADAVSRCIGEKAFSLDDKEFSLGLIQSVSAVFITRREDGKMHWLIPAPMNTVQNSSTYQPMPWTAAERAADRPALNGYDVKKGLMNGFVSIPVNVSDKIPADLPVLVQQHIAGKPFFKESDVFKKVPQTAIRQANNEDNKGFRIHHRIYFHEKASAFAVVAELGDFIPGVPLLVSMGARNSLFRVKATKLTTDEVSTSVMNGGCLIALSPMLLPEKWRDMIAFAIVNRQKIRQMKRKDGPGIAYRHDATLRFFAAPGSVFYIRPEYREAFIEAINQQTALRCAGFSQYFILNEEAIQ